MTASRTRLQLFTFLLATLLAAAATAQEGEAEAGEETGWFDTAELSAVATAGNAEATTLGFANTLRRVWPAARFKLEAGGLRAETTDRRRRAVGTPDDFRLREEEETRLSAESYHLRGRYEGEISERTYWFTGAGWERNQFAGIENRFSVVAGAGRLWRETETTRLATDAGLTFTDQENVVEAPGGDDSFLGLRLSAELRRQLTATTTFEGGLTVDENLDDTSDLRADLAGSVAVAMSERLSLKVSLGVLFDNQPALVAVPLESPDGTPTGETVEAELEEVDSTLKVALVVDF